MDHVSKDTVSDLTLCPACCDDCLTNHQPIRKEHPVPSAPRRPSHTDDGDEQDSTTSGTGRSLKSIKTKINGRIALCIVEILAPVILGTMEEDEDDGQDENGEYR